MSLGRGQTYNVEIEGVLSAVRDPTVIPRDGSVAVAVVTFNGNAIVRAPFQEIGSGDDAENFAAKVENLKCSNLDSMIDPCPIGDTNYDLAIHTAANHLNQNRRPGARLVLLMATDGEPTDPDIGRTAALEAEMLGNSELDAILMGLDPQSQEFSASKAKVDQIVFPKPVNDLPGATLKIDAGPCTLPGADFGPDCERQVREFAELTRSVLRAVLARTSLRVTTEADPPPNTPIGDMLSLRQAIERANCNDGPKIITFANNVKTIRPLGPLPALTASDITICGCVENNCASSTNDEINCVPLVTIDGSKIDLKGGQLIDGILIRSNHDTVRGLKITNFTRAGIAIDPISQFDVVGHNRVESNTLENNKVAGVLVKDPLSNGPGGFGDRGLNAVVHNIGNTILGNTILDSLDCATPIDLGGDGRTDNDLCDVDEGPNTLLNFPRITTVTQSGDGVTVTGTVCDPNCAEEVCPPNLIGAVVEILAVTRIVTSCAPSANGLTALQGATDNRVITGVLPLARGTTNTDGSFKISGVGASPTCGYTATVTDLAGNTSELMFPAAGFAKAKTTNLDFQDFEGVADPNQRPQSGTFTIENTGFAPLNVSFASITRDGFPHSRLSQFARADDRKRFPIDPIIVGAGGQTITIQPGQTQPFAATFDPEIPPVFKRPKPPASVILPDTVNDTIALVHNGCAGSDSTISLIGHVSSKIVLIDPDRPRSNPLVTLNRSGDVFTVVFSIYDSDQDVASVVYEFFDQAGGLVDLNQPERDLSRVVEQARADGRLQVGQSFSIMQTFSNAKQHRNVATVTVTVSDNGGSNAKASGSIISSTSNASARSLLDRGRALLVLPVARFETASDRRARRAEGSTGSNAAPGNNTLVRRSERSQVRERRIAND
jgi:uncharacterized protein YegL